MQLDYYCGVESRDPSTGVCTADPSMTSASADPRFRLGQHRHLGVRTALHSPRKIASKSTLTPSSSQSQHSIQNAITLSPPFYAPQTPPSLLHLPSTPLNKRPRGPRSPHRANPHPLPQPPRSSKRNLTAITPRTTR
jgi:hypothetical protein